jgi:flavin-dependent dehydrogenase
MPMATADTDARASAQAAARDASGVCDVAVVGGGPAGSTVATLLARKGWRVTLLEKARHPRFHIGESLLPMNLPILERLGVYEQVAAIGVRKLGADFPDEAGGYNTFRFARALDAQRGHAFQVRRADFDQVLFAHARAGGVDAREEAEAVRVELEPPGGGVELTVREHGAERTLRARYLVDASGRDTFLGAKLKLKRKNMRHQSAAVFSHFRGVARREGEDAGNISIYRHDHGWIWLIPLPDDVMSVGAVCYPDYMKTRRGDTEGFLMRTLALVPEVAQRMHGAERAAPVHVTGNYAYECTRMGGPNWLLVGDAWTFVDPMFSSGVYLAMHGAERAADVVDAALREPARGPALQRALEKHLVRGIDEFKWFIYRFTAPAMRALFASPRDVLQIERGVLGMISGDVFDSPRVRRRLRLFRVLYALTALGMAPQALRNWRRRRRQPNTGFGGDTLQADPP